MKTITKFNLSLGKSEMLIPTGATFLTVETIANTVTLFALVDPTVEHKQTKFLVTPTGEKFNETGLRFIGTTLLQDTIWHVFVNEN